MLGIKRGNRGREIQSIWQPLEVRALCERTGLARLSSAYQHCIENPKPLPKKGRPKLPGTPQTRKAQRRREDLKNKGVLFLFD